MCFYDDTRYRVMFTLLLHFPCNRVQREQIVAKQQEEETARLKNCGRIPKGSKDGLRPESPHSRRTRRPSVRKMLHASKKRYEGKRAGQEQLDTTKPIAISEEEELERITSLLQRDNLIRGLGVVEFVYKLLHCTPGTGGPQKNCTLHHSFVLFDRFCWSRIILVDLSDLMTFFVVVTNDCLYFNVLLFAR